MTTTVHAPSIEDRHVASPTGRIFTRRWQAAAETKLGPIVLLHDSLGSVELWRSFPAALCQATGRTVVAYDRLGFGQSDARHDTLALDFIAAEGRTDFAHVLTAWNIEQFVVLGHSVGGGMATHIAAHYGTSCIALITESAQALVEERTLEGIKTAQELFHDPAQVARLARYHGDKASWVLNAWINTWLSPEFANWSLRDILPHVHCPVLAIHGEHDEYGSTRNPELIVELSAGPAQLEIIPETQHVPHRENESHIVQKIAHFLGSKP